MKIDRTEFIALLKAGGYIQENGQVLLREAFGDARPAGGDRLEGFDEAADRAFSANAVCAVAVLSTAPFTLAAARAGRALPAVLDDQAQLAGVAIPCARDFSAVKGRLARRRAVLVRDRGCLCLGEDFYEVQAMAMVAEKAALARIATACLGGGARIGLADALLMRFIYRYKYGRMRA
jgi:hypothetical protein